MREDIFNFFVKPPPDPAASPPVLKSISVRLPASLLAYIDVLAEHGDVSRNAMSVRLLEWGVQDCLAHLPDGMRDEIGESVEGPDYHLTKDQ